MLSYRCCTDIFRFDGIRDGRATDACATARIRVALETLQLGAHFRGVLIPQVAVLLQRAVDDVFQFGRDLAVEAHRRWWCLMQDAIEYRSRSISLER